MYLRSSLGLLLSFTFIEVVTYLLVRVISRVHIKKNLKKCTRGCCCRFHDGLTCQGDDGGCFGGHQTC